MTPILGIMASQISGHLYAPTGSMYHIASTTLSTTAATVSFSSIAADYTHLQVRCLTRSSAGSAGLSGIQVTFNSDTTSGNYSFHRLVGDGSSASAYGQTGLDYILSNSNTANTAGMFATSNVDILDYANTNKYKTTRALTACDLNNTLGSISLRSQVWLSSSAITSILFTPSTGSFDTYSSFALYGVR